MGLRQALVLAVSWLAVGEASRLTALDRPVVAAAAPTASPDAAVEGWRIESTDSQVKIEPHAPVRIENRFGDVRLRSNRLPELAVRAALQHSLAEPALRVELVQVSGEWRLTVVEPSETARRGDGPPRRADLAVVLPPDCPVTVLGGKGLVEARGFSARLAVETSSGEVRLRGSGAVAVRSESGPVRMAFHPSVPSAPSRIETTTGAVEVELPPHADLDARLESQGSFTTDFSLDVERIGPLTKRARAHLGSGGPELRLVSRSGALSLLERVADSSAASP